MDTDDEINAAAHQERQSELERATTGQGPATSDADVEQAEECALQSLERFGQWLANQTDGLDSVNGAFLESLLLADDEAIDYSELMPHQLLALLLQCGERHQSSAIAYLRGAYLAKHTGDFL
jgi:hypothetical protein